MDEFIYQPKVDELICYYAYLFSLFPLFHFALCPPLPHPPTHPHLEKPIVAREAVDDTASGVKFIATNFDETMFIMETGSLDK